MRKLVSLESKNLPPSSTVAIFPIFLSSEVDCFNFLKLVSCFRNYLLANYANNQMTLLGYSFFYRKMIPCPWYMHVLTNKTGQMNLNFWLATLAGSVNFGLFAFEWFTSRTGSISVIKQWITSTLLDWNEGYILCSKPFDWFREVCG